MTEALSDNRSKHSRSRKKSYKVKFQKQLTKSTHPIPTTKVIKSKKKAFTDKSWEDEIQDAMDYVYDLKHRFDD